MNCSKCGTVINNDSKFCSKCGGKIINKSKKPIYKMLWIYIVLVVSISVVFGTYTYYINNCTFEAQVYNFYEYLMDKYPNPANELHVNQFKDVQAYSEKFNSLSNSYEKELDKTVSKNYNITEEEAVDIYVKECMRRQRK